MRTTRRGWLLGFAAVAGIVAVAVLVSVVRITGEGDRPLLKVSNQTERPVVIFDVWGDGSEHQVMTVAAGTSTELTTSCGSGKLVARTLGGAVVSVREGSVTCDLAEWVISGR